MIDPHVHLRDWDQREKETLAHGLEVALRAGLDGVFEMPNTSPPLTTRRRIEERLVLAQEARKELRGEIFHGLYAGLTLEADQVREVVRAHGDLFPRIVGLKLFAGHSTGNMGIVEEEAQRRVYRLLAEEGFRGVLAVHCEKEALLLTRDDGSPDWDASHPETHAMARPPEAETAAVLDQIRFASMEGFRGTLHIAHISVPEALEAARNASEAKVTCGICPHHALFDAEAMRGEAGLLLKMNPPLRPRALQQRMFDSLLAGEIDWIETDHAPHTLRDKLSGYASGIPGFPYYPRFIELLRSRGISEALLDRITHDAIEECFGFEVPRHGREPEMDLAGEYPFDAMAPSRPG